MEFGYLEEILRALNGAERVALRKYLDSPYLNSREDVRALFDCLITPGDKHLRRHEVFERIFPGRPFDARQLNYTVSYLSKLAEDFIAQREWDTEPGAQDMYLLRGLRRRQLPRLSERSARAIEKRMEKQALRDAAYFRQRFVVAFEEFRTHLQQGRSRVIDFEALTSAHEKAFIYEKLKLGCMLQSRQTVTAGQYGAGFLPNVLDFLHQHPWLEEPAIAAWYHGYYVLTDQQGAGHFERLKDLIFQHAALLPIDERHDLFLLAINFCIRRINSGDPLYSKDLFDLYREGLLQGVLLEDGVLSRWSYNNIANSALKMGEIAWALQFVEDFRQRLEPAFRDTTYYFNLARCLYEKADYYAALECLTRIEYDDVLQNLSAKTLQMKIYYETAAWQSLDSLLDSTAIYLRRKKVLGYHRENFSNIVRMMQRLVALPPGPGTARNNLRTEVEQCKVLSEKNWFLQKIDSNQR